MSNFNSRRERQEARQAEMDAAAHDARAAVAAERDRYREALEMIIASAEELTEEFGEVGTHQPLEMIAHAALKMSGAGE